MTRTLGLATTMGMQRPLDVLEAPVMIELTG